MNLLPNVVGIIGGLLLGSLDVFLDSRSKERTKRSLAHRPQLPYFALFYMVLSLLAFALNLPALYQMVVTGMIGMESAMYVWGGRLKSSN